MVIFGKAVTFYEHLFKVFIDCLMDMLKKNQDLWADTVLLQDIKC